MTLRPMDENGDILPVSSSSRMCSGANAVGHLAFLRLKLYQGDWWEDEEEGCELLELLRRNRISNGNLSLLSSSLSNYLAETPGVVDIQGAEISLNNHLATYTCQLITEEDPVPFSSEMMRVYGRDLSCIALPIIEFLT